MPNIILTGFPGVGKTTLIKKIINYLRSKNVEVSGFYTEEVRNDSRSRIGFDVVTLDGQHGVLARTKQNTNENTKYFVGQYLVFPNKLEALVLPLINSSKVVVIDEVGKMELFSEKFRVEVENLFKEPNKIILATIPVNKGRPIKFVEDIRTNPQNMIFTVNKDNRNELFDEIITKLPFE